MKELSFRFLLFLDRKNVQCKTSLITEVFQIAFISPEVCKQLFSNVVLQQGWLTHVWLLAGVNPTQCFQSQTFTFFFIWFELFLFVWFLIPFQWSQHKCSVLQFSWLSPLSLHYHLLLLFCQHFYCVLILFLIVCTPFFR